MCLFRRIFPNLSRTEYFQVITLIMVFIQFWWFQMLELCSTFGRNADGLLNIFRNGMPFSLEWHKYQCQYAKWKTSSLSPCLLISAFSISCHLIYWTVQILRNHFVQSSQRPAAVLFASLLSQINEVILIKNSIWVAFGIKVQSNNF